MYCGKVDLTHSGSVGDSIVHKLSAPLLNEGRVLYTDNFYTSCTLARSLLSKKTYLVGTVRKNRRFLPSDVILAKLKKGEIVSRESHDGIMVCKWKDARDVIMLSTIHSPALIPVKPKQVVGDGQGSSRKREKIKPHVVVDYNLGKCGVDRSDQMASYVAVHRKGVKWYRKAAIELLTATALINAHVLYKQVTKKQVKITKFQADVARSLLGLEHDRPNACSPAASSKGLSHLFRKRENNRTADRKQCKSCYNTLVKQKVSRSDARRQVKKVKTLRWMPWTTNYVSSMFYKYSFMKRIFFILLIFCLTISL